MQSFPTAEWPLHCPSTVCNNRRAQRWFFFSIQTQIRSFCQLQFVFLPSFDMGTNILLSFLMGKTILVSVSHFSRIFNLTLKCTWLEWQYSPFVQQFFIVCSSLRLIFTLASHFLWVAVLHPEENKITTRDDRLNGMKFGQVTSFFHYCKIGCGCIPLQKEPTLSMFCRQTLHWRFFLKAFSLKTWGSPFPDCIHTQDNTRKV